MVNRAILFLLLVPTLMAQTKPDARRRFELASIKPNNSGQRSAVQTNPLIFSQGGRLTATNVTLVDVIVRVYPTRRIQMQGGPDWIDVERFDIIAKADEADGEIKPEDRNAMVQTLLEDRFKLQFHIESKEMPVLALAIDKEAPKLQDAKEPGPSAFTTTRSGEMIFKSSSIIGLVNLMANILQTPVVDGTGIKGLYDFSLDPMRFAPPPSDRTGDGFDRAQAVVMAVQEQLGLKLEKRRANLDITIIDRAERPAN